MSKEYDLVILGGGTGGYVAAIKAAQSGMSVAIVEQDKVGGTCLHKGCIPSKALLQSANVYRETKEAAQFGVNVEDVSFQLDIAQKRKTEIVEKLYAGVQALLKKGNISIYKGKGRILGPSIFSPLPGTISIEHGENEENTMLIPKYIIIATGSQPKEIATLPVDGTYIVHSDHILQLEEIPTSVAIIGGGVIGIEWASLLQDIGVQVTVFETADHILMTEDKEIRTHVQRALEKRGVDFETNCTIDSYSIDEEANNITITYIDETSKQLTVDKVLLSVGRKANTDDIGLENTNIKLEHGNIQTNEYFQTEESHIYAVGDCIGGLQLAHVASAEGMVAVEHMLKEQPHIMQELNVPRCIYSFPEVGAIGLTEEDARNAGYDVKIGRFPYQANGKALIKGETEGFIKLISDKETDDILGIHLVGPQATDMISEGSLAKLLDASTFEFQNVIRPHPSLSEVFTEVALEADGKPIHL
ncbi:MAG TPA: dihydrolipoyl dehydrogenase [Candidatus Pseudogracilibacillus intestinigallinarum]|uniref:Dihydrolipoyl dehydrogenase n=1 Tax=Candidatus Pseudogracilibacillus intestinigallinarum TaxID=2838742 RepID=A0A9D1PNH4_9BACI|nr:dihydrolipoyl dehydrogenase [Candidatus Pseudogracilibacillus intestinigallinarum]